MRLKHRESDPSYYAIIPADVRYDKKLTANAKLLYGEITALCNQKGFCWATNKYFADLYKVSNTSISLWVKQLCEKYIRYEILDGYRRKIYLKGALRKLKPPIKEIKTPPKENIKGVLKKLKDNTTLNTTDNKQLIVSPDGEKKSELVKHYEGLLKQNDIKYIPIKREYIAFYRQVNKYMKDGVTIEHIKKALDIWFEMDIGDWCGYKLSNFWMDIGKIQLAGKPKLSKGDKAFMRMQKEAQGAERKVQ